MTSTFPERKLLSLSQKVLGSIPAVIVLIYSEGDSRLTYGAFPLQRAARFKRAVTSAARLWLRFHLA